MGKIAWADERIGGRTRVGDDDGENDYHYDDNGAECGHDWRVS